MATREPTGVLPPPVTGKPPHCDRAENWIPFLPMQCPVTCSIGFQRTTSLSSATRHDPVGAKG
jgi:hypothetical protein